MVHTSGRQLKNLAYKKCERTMMVHTFSCWLENTFGR